MNLNFKESTKDKFINWISALVIALFISLITFGAYYLPCLLGY